MRFILGVAVFCTALLAVSLVQADCCKIPILSCPPGMTPEQTVQTATQTNPQAAQNQGNPGSTTTSTQPAPGGTGTGTGPDPSGGNIEPPSPTDPNQRVQTFDAMGFFKEPTQEAVIAWNGTEQIMVLTTHEISKSKSVMMSFMPLPGEPIDIRKGDNAIHDKAYNLIKSKIKLAGVDIASMNVAVLFKKIGSHNIFVWRVDNPAEFLDKVQVYVKKKFNGKAVAFFTKQTEAVIQKYCNEGFKYFAFDITEVEPKLSEKIAIEYHFKSKFLYYPLVVSSGAAKGDTKVQLIVLTDTKGVNKQKGNLKFYDKNTDSGHIFMLGGADKGKVTLTPQEVSNLSPRMAKLFNNQPALGRIWIIRGKTEDIPGDVMMYRQ